MRKWWILGLVSVVTIVLDQVTKQLVHQAYALGESIPVISGWFNLTYVRNTGAAFGILSQADPAFRVPFFLLVPVVALAAIGYVFKKIPNEDSLLSTALSLVIGGAVGNLIDRSVFGYVIDFLDFHYRYTYHFPAFNVADIAICVGVGILMLDMYRQDKLGESMAGKAKNVSNSV